MFFRSVKMAFFSVTPTANESAAQADARVDYMVAVNYRIAGFGVYAKPSADELKAYERYQSSISSVEATQYSGAVARLRNHLGAPWYDVLKQCAPDCLAIFERDSKKDYYEINAMRNESERYREKLAEQRRLIDMKDAEIAQLAVETARLRKLNAEREAELLHEPNIEPDEEYDHTVTLCECGAFTAYESTQCYDCDELLVHSVKCEGCNTCYRLNEARNNRMDQINESNY